MLKYLFNPYSLIIALVVLFGTLQFQLWFGQGGMIDIQRLNKVIGVAEQKNMQLSNRNHALQANIDDLKHGQDATEEEARSELGMVKPDESYYQILGDPSDNQSKNQ
jgi:cell division protein FtsB